MKKKAAEKIDEDWMTTYGDMVTLLLCFVLDVATTMQQIPNAVNNIIFFILTNLLFVIYSLPLCKQYD